MVVDTVQSKKDFSARLDKALTYAGIPRGRKRITAVSKLFGVSREAVRKWLAGESIPDTKRIAAIAQHTGVRGEWLLTSQGPMRYGDEEDASEQDLPPYALQLARLIAKAPPGKIKAILMLLGVEEEEAQSPSQKEMPCSRPARTPGKKERRSGEDRRSGQERRQNVQEVDFERRSGLDRRDDAEIILYPGENLINKRKGNKRRPQRKGKDDPESHK